MRIFLFTLLLILCLNDTFAQATEASYRISGEITTVDNQIYKGFIIWNQNKMFWIDFFEASKPENPYTAYFKSSGISFNNNTSEIPPIHSFCCRFGDIKKIRLTAENQIELQIKEGYAITLKKGGFDDIGQPVRISSDSGEIEIAWEKISEIEFKPTNTSAINSLNAPITGIVKTPQGIYKGLITWDGRDRTINNSIKGKNTTGNTVIEFGNINKIIKEKNAFQVNLNNGYITTIGTKADFNNLNQGILVNMPSTGSVFIPWRNFEFLETSKPYEINILSYENFKAPQRLYGEVTTRNNEKVKGVIIYDLDESMDIEILNGKNDNIDYKIPFKYIASIEPKNYKYSFITLRNGASLSLGDTADVSNGNSGILVFTSNDSSPVYIPWQEVKLIILE